MQKRIIKSAISLSLVGAMMIGLCSCNSSPIKIENTDTEETLPAVTETVQNLSLSATAYTGAKESAEIISEAAEKGDTKVLSEEADNILESIKTIRSRCEEDFAQTRKNLSDYDEVILQRQKEYEENILSSLEKAESAAKGLKDKNQAVRKESADTIAELFKEDEEREIVTLGQAYNNIKTPPKTTSTSASAEYSAPTEADLALTGEVAINDDIKAVCDRLGTAKGVYEFVKNGIEYSPYYHLKKGATATFEQLCGNDADQASLLIGMLRYLGIPAKYTQGRVFITKEQAVSMTGADTPEHAGALLAAQYKPVFMYTDNGELSGFIIDQTWVQAYVPYTDYRGAGNKSGDKVWVSLDPSFKALKVEPITFDNDRSDDILVKNLQSVNPDYRPDEKITFYSRYIDITSDTYLPVSLPYEVRKITRTFSAMPSDFTDSISISIGWSGTLMNCPVYELYGKSVTVSFEPESDSDRQLIENYGGTDKVPAYLVSAVPTVTIDGEQHGGQYAVTLGTSQTMNITLQNAGGSVSIPDTIHAGSVYAVNVDTQIISKQELSKSEERVNAVKESVTSANIYNSETLAPILDFAGKWYFSSCDAYNTLAAVSLDINRNRQIAVALTGYRMTAETWFGYVRSLSCGDFVIDVDYNNVSAISYTGDENAEKNYMFVSGMHESSFEGTLWQDILGDDDVFGISTISLFSIGYAAGIQPVILSQANFDSDIKKCHISDTAKNTITDYIYQGRVVTVMPEEFTIGDWKGTAYIVADMTDGSAVYMISGGIAGGSTARDYEVRYTGDPVHLHDIMDTDRVVSICFYINHIMSAVQQEMALYNLIGDVAALETAPLNVAGLGVALKTAGDIKSFADATQMYYDNIDKFLNYFISDGSEADKAVLDMLVFTATNILGLVMGMVWDKALENIPGIKVEGGEIEISDLLGVLSIGEKYGEAVSTICQAFGLLDETQADWVSNLIGSVYP